MKIETGAPYLDLGLDIRWTWKGLVYDIPGVTYTTISGFHGGIFTNIRIGDAVALEPGAYYSMKGCT